MKNMNIFLFATCLAMSMVSMGSRVEEGVNGATPARLLVDVDSAIDRLRNGVPVVLGPKEERLISFGSDIKKVFYTPKSDVDKEQFIEIARIVMGLDFAGLVHLEYIARLAAFCQLAKKVQMTSDWSYLRKGPTYAGVKNNVRGETSKEKEERFKGSGSDLRALFNAHNEIKESVNRIEKPIYNNGWWNGFACAAAGVVLWQGASWLKGYFLK